MANYPKYPAESKNLMISLISGIIVALVVLAIDILNEYNLANQLCILWVGFGALFFLLLVCLTKFTSLKEGPLSRKKR